MSERDLAALDPHHVRSTIGKKLDDIDAASEVVPQLVGALPTVSKVGSNATVGARDGTRSSTGPSPARRRPRRPSRPSP